MNVDPSRLAGRWSGLLIALLLMALAPLARAAATLTTLGPDALGIGRVVTQLDATGHPTALSTLGDGSTAYHGLSFRSADQRFYALASDPLGQSSLVSFDAGNAASLVTLAPLGSGLSGMTYRVADDAFYAASTPASGDSTLLRITAAGSSSVVGALGVGFLGGLTTGSAPGLLYGISADALGVQRRLQQIDVATGLATPLFELGDGSLGFDGGLSWNDDTDRFEIIGSDFLGDSGLYTFDLSGPASLGLAGSIGPGYLHAGLVRAEAIAPPPPPPPVPEPGTPALLLAALVGFLAALPATRPRRLRMTLASALRRTLPVTLALAAAAAQAQFSSPMRDVENPDRFLFQERGSTTIASNYFNNFIYFPTPAGKRYIVEHVALQCTTPSNSDSFPSVLLTLQRTTGPSTAVGYAVPALQMVRRGPAAFGGVIWAGSSTVKVFSDPEVGDPTGGSAIYLNIYHSDTTVPVSCFAVISGHTITP